MLFRNTLAKDADNNVLRKCDTAGRGEAMACINEAERPQESVTEMVRGIRLSAAYKVYQRCWSFALYLPTTRMALIS
jgi:hypothetical protein